MSAGCLFCDREIIREGLIEETPNFYVRANINGSLGPGHLMIIPKSHLDCYGRLSLELEEEFFNLKKKVLSKYLKVFPPPILVEQGVHGQSITHAHLHFIPSISPSYNLSNINLLEYCPKIPYVFTKVSDSLDFVRKIFNQEGEYVSLEAEDKLYVFRTKNFPLKFRPGRDIPAKITGNRKLNNWNTMTPVEQEQCYGWAKQTVKKMIQHD